MIEHWKNVLANIFARRGKARPAKPRINHSPITESWVSFDGQPSLPFAYKKGDFIGEKYEVYDILGAGGCGVVYLVYSHETRSVYALKTFRDEYLRDQRVRERFRREASVWVDLDRHPNLVRAHFV